MKSANRIGLLGGSFNPVHKGHRSIAQSFLNSEFIDELWILLTPESPHKEGEDLAGYDHRLNMLRLAFEDWDNVRISDFERSLPTPSFTIQTITALKDHHPDKEFYLCLGEDSLKGFTTWHQWQKILDEVTLLVATRPNSEIENENLIRKAYFVRHNNIAVSSTEIREKMARGVDVQDLIPDSVLDYIKDRELYTS